MSIFRIIVNLIKFVINPNGHKRHFVPKEKSEKFVILNDDKLEITYLQLLRGATKNDLYISIDETIDICKDACFRRVIIDFRGGTEYSGELDEIITYLNRIKRILFLRIAVIVPSDTVVTDINSQYGREKLDSKVYVKAFIASSDAINWLIKKV